jgi:hypothetical protein
MLRNEMFGGCGHKDTEVVKLGTPKKQRIADSFSSVSGGW